MDADFQRADALQEAFLKGSAYAHGFAGGLHLGAQGVVGVGELVEGEPGHLGDYIVQRRLKGSAGVGQADLVQSHSHADFCRNPGDGITAGFGGQGRGAGYSGVDFDEVILEGFGIQCKLDIAATLNSQRANQLQGGVAEHLVFLVCQRLGGTHYDGVAGVNANRIQIFHVADGNGGIIGIPHNFVFDFLIALDALFHQNLVNRGEHQSVFHDFPEFFLRVGETAAGAPQGKGGPKHHRIANLLRCFQPLFHGIGNGGGKHRFPQLLT